MKKLKQRSSPFVRSDGDDFPKVSNFKDGKKMYGKADSLQVLKEQSTFALRVFHVPLDQVQDFHPPRPSLMTSTLKARSLKDGR